MEIQKYKEKSAKDIAMVLVGNKCDFEAEREVPPFYGFSMAGKYGIPFIETSAKTAINVKEAFELLIAEWERKCG